MNEFDQKAAEWDKDEQHTDRARQIAKAMMQSIPFHKGMKAMEFGAGTGLLSFMLKDQFAEITLMDTSREMLRVATEKIENENLKNFKTLYIDLVTEDYNGTFDIIYNQMVLHHIMDIGMIMAKFYSILNENGILAIADLFKENGSFHGENFTGHKGFDVDELTRILAKKGFHDIHYQHCYDINKETKPGIMEKFPVFLLVASK